MSESANNNHLAALLMVSGGSDSMALLEMAASNRLEGLGPATRLKVLHVNHMLRGAQADEDQAFVERRCAELGVACESRRVDVGALCEKGSEGMEAVAREARYRAADEVLDALCAEVGCLPEEGVILTAHTLDDRIETFLMRALVGTGPGGLGSIPRVRGRIQRPLLSWGREELRDWLRQAHPGMADSQIWRDDPTNDDGSNFRSRVRRDIMPVLRQVHPGFERNLERTMDLIAEEDDAAQQQALSLVYRNLQWDGAQAVIPTGVFKGLSRPLARRTLRQCLLVANPQSRLEARQIDRVLDALGLESFSTEVDGGVRVLAENGKLTIFKAQ